MYHLPPFNLVTNPKTLCKFCLLQHEKGTSCDHEADKFCLGAW
jgi:hypothetical protein